MPDLSKPTQAWNLVWDADWVSGVAFLGSHRRVAAGNNLGQILLWELPEKPGGEAPKPVARLDGHTNVVSRLAATPDGKTLISASYDHTIRYWDIPQNLPDPSEPLVLNARAIEDATRRKANGARVPPALEAKIAVLKSAKTLTEHKEWIVGMELSRDGAAIISGDDGGHVLVWDRVAGSVRQRWRVKGWAYAVALSPGGKQACATERFPLVFDSGRHAAVQLWDVAAAKVEKDLSALFKGQHLGAAAYSPDGKLLALGRGGEVDGNNGKITLVDPVAGKVVRELAPGHLNGLTDLAFHPDGKHIASSGRDTVVRVWEVATGKLVAEVGKGRGGQFKDWIGALAWSPDGAWLACGDMIGAVQIWHFPASKG
jgi:WD40 repeat protein